MLSSVWEDVRYAGRLLARQPGFSVAAVILLALGIGANSAIFSLVDSVLLRPLPYKDLDRLYYLQVRDLTKGRPPALLSLPEFLDYESQARSFSSMAGLLHQPVTLTRGPDPVTVMSVFVSKNYLDTLGIKLMLGRPFLPEEYLPKKNQAVILTFGLWRSRFGGDPGVIGQTVRLDSELHVITGVLPELKGEAANVDLYLPMPYTRELLASRDRTMTVMVKLDSRASEQQAGHEIRAISRRQAEIHPETNAGLEAYLIPAMTDARGGATQSLGVLGVAVGLVLLICCANLASLLLVRASGRMREIAIRSAMGASQGRIFRQMITESVMLSMTGGCLGLLIAWWCVGAVKQWGLLRMPRLSDAAVNGNVLIFTFLLSVAAGVLFGSAPALQALSISLSRTLGEESRGSSGGTHRSVTRSLLVIFEVSLSVILLVAAGLLLRTYAGLVSIDTGFQPQRVLCMRTIMPTAKYESVDERSLFVRRVIQRLESLPGVTSAGGSGILPLSPANWAVDFSIEGRSHGGGISETAHYNSITPRFFETIGARMVRGRAFTDADDLTTQPVIIISESMASNHFPGEDPIGRMVRFELRQETTQARIVGVVRDISLRRLDEKPRAMIYQPYAQRTWSWLFFVARTNGDPSTLESASRRAIYETDSEVPVDRIVPMMRLVKRVMAQQELAMVLLTSFSALALVLAVVGLYGVMAMSVSQRGREIGIRMALGAHGTSILGLILKQGLGLTLAGLAAGLAVAPIATQALRQMLYGVKPLDAVTFAAVAVLLFVTSVAACVVPALRASRVDPGKALRE